MLARDYSTPPPMIGRLKLADFAALTDAIDAEIRAAQHKSARDRG